MVKYVHIGYPKNFSTSLQRDYFSKHPELFHLGIGLENNLGYKDSMTEKTLEVYLKTCKHFKYKEVEKKIIHHFQEAFQNAQKQKYKAVGVSAEHLGFAFTHDGLSGQEKAERLFRIFGNNTKIIMIVRNQFDLIKSLYRECVRVGFYGDFPYFVELLYKYQDRNFVYDFRYDYMYSTYSKLFGADNINVMFFEEYRDEKGNLLKENSKIKLFTDLNRCLGVSDNDMELGHYNEAIASNKILIKAELNKSYPHDLGNHLMESAEKHRIKKYLEEDLGFYEPEEKTYSDVLVKRNSIQKTVALNKEAKLSYTANMDFVKFFKTFYEQGNENMAALLKVDLPQKYMSLKF